MAAPVFEKFRSLVCVSPICLGALVSCCLGLAQTAWGGSLAGNLLGNGSFESPGFDYTGQGGRYRYLDDAGDTSITGWRITRPQGAGERVYWYHSSLYEVFEGSYGLALTDAGRAQTTVSVTAGELYEVELSGAYDLNNPVSSFALRFSLGGASLTLLPADTIDTGISLGDQNWRRYRTRLRPTSGGLVSLTIENLAEGIATADGGVAIDDVALRAVVPEPAGGVLAGIGLAASLAMGWRMKRHAVTRAAGEDGFEERA